MARRAAFLTAAAASAARGMARRAAFLAAAAAAAAAAVGAAPRSARANPYDFLGVTPRSRALGGALTAAPRDGEAAYFNPAAGAFARDFALGVDYDVARLDLRIDGERVDAYGPHGLGVTMLVPRRLGARVSVAMASALHLPGVGVARLLFTPPAAARFALLDNRANRLAVYVGAGLRWGEHLAFGAGLHFLAAAGTDARFDIGGRGEDANVPTARVDARLPLRASPVASVLVRPARDWALGLTWRGPIGLDFDIRIAADVDLPSIANGAVDITMLALDYYTPSQLALGAAWGGGARPLLVAADVTWVHWSPLDRLLADLTVNVNLDTRPPILASPVPAPGLHDTVEARLGAQWSGTFGATESRWSVRAGYGLMPTPVRPQTGLTSIADATRHAVTVGGGIDLAELYPLLDRPLSIDVAFGAQVLQRRLTVKEDPTGPFRSYRQDGVVWHGSVGLTVRF
jgi:hypothetical protein